MEQARVGRDQMAASWWRRLSDLSFALMLFLLAFPETVTGKIYIGPFPIYFFVFYLGLVALAIEMTIEGRSLARPARWILVLWITMLGVGALRGHPLKYAVIDASSFLGLFAGVQWAALRGEVRVLDQWRWWLVVITGFLVIAVIGLKLGLITPSRISGRVYVYSAFRATFFMVILLPAIVGSGRMMPSRGASIWIESIGRIVPLGVIFLAAVVMATRSILLEGLVAWFLCQRVLLHHFRGVKFLALLAVGTLCFLAAFAGIFEGIDFGMLGQRIQGTSVEGEARWMEIEMLWAQMTNADLAMGMGFGSRFESVVIVDGSNLALHPHMAIFAFLQKGGIPLFLLGIIVPALLALAGVIRGGDQQRTGWIAKILVTGTHKFIFNSC
ncbi:hypothetical protein SCG7086_BM_00070 [Chlamydiales bacterium SCGC AG-110-P3]|nr:hypothetical protein SCG7086_BM_00070 [Chlamydiales bacterium SCGC AG-110-P3]